MRASEFAPVNSNLEEGMFQKVGTWFRSIVPSADSKMAGGEKEMTAYAEDFTNKMLKIAGRYTDNDNKRITIKTLQQLESRAPYLFMKNIMKLGDGDIAGILKALAKKGKIATAKPVTVQDINNQDNTLESVWGVRDGKAAEILLDKLIGIAAIRKMEIDYLSDPSHQTEIDNPQAIRQVYKQAAQPSQASQATQPAPALNVASINATLQALGNLP